MRQSTVGTSEVVVGVKLRWNSGPKRMTAGPSSIFEQKMVGADLILSIRTGTMSTDYERP